MAGGEGVVPHPPFLWAVSFLPIFFAAVKENGTNKRIAIQGVMIRAAIQEGVRVLDKKVVIQGAIEIVRVIALIEHIRDTV